MAEQTHHQQPDPAAPRYGEAHYIPPKPRWGPIDYFWFLLKNILGWLLILAAMVAGPIVPGPGGIPLFLIGFALITFPGKRRLTARVLCGRPVHRESSVYRHGLAGLAILLPGAMVGWLLYQYWGYFSSSTYLMLPLAALDVALVAFIWTFGLRGVHIINIALCYVPRIRRKIRPWLRRRGLDLLPPRRRGRLRHPGSHHEPDEEILEIHERHQRRLRVSWDFIKPWFIRLLRVAVIVGVFAWMLRPVFRRWDEVRGPILATNWWHFAAAAAMFSLFLFVFRALVWRRIMIGFGHRLPVAAATRIWSFSELARYLPGVIWQVVGRVYLAKPYGISGTVSSASQVLELTIFMLANILVAITCLAAAGLRRIPADQRHWLLVVVLFIPFLLALLHPKVFYTLLNRLMARLGKPPIAQALRKREITMLVLWTIIGLLWQSLAVWILTSSVLHLPIEKWYVLAGSYCLAWTIGFSVGFLSPGGMGIRELVFITTMQFVLPPWVVQNVGDQEKLRAFLGIIGVLLRLWAMSGELMMAGVAYVGDYRGATNAPDAPGRVPLGAKVGEAE